MGPALWQARTLPRRFRFRIPVTAAIPSLRNAARAKMVGRETSNCRASDGIRGVSRLREAGSDPPRKRVENGYIESVHGRLRDECLKGERFLRLGRRCAFAAAPVGFGV
jgi:hypothetical protein